MGKQYDLTTEEGLKRFNIFRENLVEIREFNADKTNTYIKGITSYTDLTHAEYLEDRGLLVKHQVKNQKNNTKEPIEEVKRLLSEEKPENLTLPFTPIDWRSSKGVNPPQQANYKCSSTSHMSFVAAIETCYFAKNNVLLKLSSQQAIDCLLNCETFDPLHDYRYFMKFGMMSEATYPFSGQGQKPCDYYPNKVVAKPKSWAYYHGLFKMDVVTSYESLKHCPYVTIQGFRTPRDYVGGVFNPADCDGSGSYYGLVTVVGYGVDSGVEYWIVNNHSGVNWGDKGFLKVKRRDDQHGCGITSSFWSRPSFE